MVRRQGGVADIDNTATWVKYTRKLCDQCSAVCCSLPVEVRVDDLIRMELADRFEQEEDPKILARRLQKQRLIDHFHYKTHIFTLARRADGSCIFLDEVTRRCTIYAKRPETCRNHPQIGPRSGYCAFREKQ